MIYKLFVSAAFVFLFSAFSVAQNITPKTALSEPPSQEAVEKLTKEVANISKSLAMFNERLNTFLESLNKYKGIQISERQQKLLFGYEILNQTEQLAATLRKSLLETGEREATIKRRIAQIDLNLRPENIERGIQTFGTTQTEENREGRRKILSDERSTLQTVLSEVYQSRVQLTDDLRQTEQFAQSFRHGFFAQIRDEMKDF